MPRAMFLVLAMLSVALVFAVAQFRPRNREQRLPTPNQSSSPEQNKVLARRVFDDLLTQGRYGEVNSIYESNATVHFGNRTESLGEAVDEGRGWRNAAPDLVMSAEQITADGDMVTVNWVARGTHTGNGHGLKPTGKHFMVRGRSQFKIVNGRIAEAWNSEYRDDLFHQLGVPKTAALILETAQDLQASLHQVFVEPFTASAQ
jgi:predicted ester cyclase